MENTDEGETNQTAVSSNEDFVNPYLNGAPPKKQLGHLTAQPILSVGRESQPAPTPVMPV